MSRIGRQPITIPQGVQVNIADGVVIVKGPKGELKQAIHRLAKVEQKDNELTVSVKNQEEKRQRALWGLYQRLIRNMIIGTTTGFSRQLEINGVGYKAEVKNDKLVLNVGHSHPVEYKVPAGIEIKVEKNLVTISGIDKQTVGQVASEIRQVRKPEPYKGKGIKYLEETIRRKTGKAASKAE